MHIHDLIGIGFGPSNVALAIALEELEPVHGRMDALFIEREPSFAWHADMLLDGAQMQISFLKDLATPRNPRSRYTFINYLHQHGRLADFTNLKTFFPSRQDFHGYLAWVASQFAEHCAYGEEVIEVLPERRAAQPPLLRIRSRNAGGAVRDRLARSLVISIGGTAHIPACFRTVAHDRRVFHSSRYLSGIERNAAAKRIALIGAGQSAAEIFLDLHGRASAPQVDLIVRSRTIRPSDDSPFVNEIFNADVIDEIYALEREERRALLHEHRHTNYASPDLELVEHIHRLFYEQRVQGESRHRLLRLHAVENVHASGAGIELTLRDLRSAKRKVEVYDAVVLATGYERERHKTLLDPIMTHARELTADRNYRVRSASALHPPVFLQGACEETHGLSDTLLSVTAIRAGEICAALAEALAEIVPSRAREEGCSGAEIVADVE